MGQNNHSGHWGINPLKNTRLFLVKPPLNQQTVQDPLFMQSPSIYWFFNIRPLKVGSFSEPYLIFQK